MVIIKYDIYTFLIVRNYLTSVQVRCCHQRGFGVKLENKQTNKQQHTHTHTHTHTQTQKGFCNSKLQLRDQGTGGAVRFLHKAFPDLSPPLCVPFYFLPLFGNCIPVNLHLIEGRCSLLLHTTRNKRLPVKL